MAAMILDPTAYFNLDLAQRAIVDKWFDSQGIDKTYVTLVSDEDGTLKVYYTVNSSMDTPFSVDFYEIKENNFPWKIIA